MKTLYFIGLGILLFFLVISEMKDTKPVDWTANYSSLKTSPYGTYALKEILENRYKDHFIEWKKTPYELDTLTQNTSYIFVNTLLKFSQIDQETLLDMAYEGNDIFIFARSLNSSLLKELGIEYEIQYDMTDSIRVSLTNPYLGKAEYLFIKQNNIEQIVSSNYTFFTQVDLNRTEILGHTQQSNANFIRISHGEGYIYVNLFPKSMSNIALVDSINYRLTENILSYIRTENVVLDRYHKGTPNEYGGISETFIFRYLMKKESFRTALYITLLGILIFSLLQSRRKQRIIPVIERPRNRTLDFVKTIGQMYHEKKDHKEIVRKMIQFLLEDIRQKYYINSHTIDKEYYQKLANKSGCQLSTVRELFILVKDLQLKKYVTSQELHRFTAALETFNNEKL